MTDLPYFDGIVTGGSFRFLLTPVSYKSFVLYISFPPYPESVPKAFTFV